MQRPSRGMRLGSAFEMGGRGVRPIISRSASASGSPGAFYLLTSLKARSLNNSLSKAEQPGQPTTSDPVPSRTGPESSRGATVRRSWTPSACPPDRSRCRNRCRTARTPATRSAGTTPTDLAPGRMVR